MEEQALWLRTNTQLQNWRQKVHAKHNGTAFELRTINGTLLMLLPTCTQNLPQERNVLVYADNAIVITS